MLRFLAIAVLVGFVVACGGSSDSGVSPSVTPRPRPTAAAQPTRPSGPTAILDPRQGPPGTTVFVDGAGWQAGKMVTVRAAEAGESSTPYAHATVRDDGSFTARFVLDKATTGSELRAGPFNLLIGDGETEIRLTFQVQSARPIPPTRTGG